MAVGLVVEVVPKPTTIGLLVNQANPRLADINIAEMQAASRTLGLQILVLTASNNDAIDEAFAALVQRGIGAAGNIGAWPPRRCRGQRLRRPFVEPGLQPASEVGHAGYPPMGIQSLHSGLR